MSSIGIAEVVFLVVVVAVGLGGIIWVVKNEDKS